MHVGAGDCRLARVFTRTPQRMRRVFGRLRSRSAHDSGAPWEAVSEQPMGRCSLGARTSLAEAVALAWHASGGVQPPAYQLRRLLLRARAPEQHSSTPSREAAPRTPDLSRGRPCESNQWGEAHLRCPRYSAAMGLRHGTLLGVPYARRTSGVVFPLMLDRLSNTAARLQEPSPRTLDSSRVGGRV